MKYKFKISGNTGAVQSEKAGSFNKAFLNTKLGDDAMHSKAAKYVCVFAMALTLLACNRATDEVMPMSKPVEGISPNAFSTVIRYEKPSNFLADFDRIVVGMPKSQVLSVLGDADFADTRFSRDNSCDSYGYEDNKRQHYALVFYDANSEVRLLRPSSPSPCGIV